MKIIAVAPDPGTARHAWRIASGGAVDPGRSTVAQIADRSIPCSGADAISRFAAVRRSRSPWLTSRSAACTSDSSLTRTTANPAGGEG